MTIPIAKANSILTLRRKAKWSIERIAKTERVSEQTVRNVLKSPARALARRTRQRGTKEIAKRRAMIQKIALQEKFEVVRGKKVACGKLFPSIPAIQGEYERRTRAKVSPATVHRDLEAIGLVSRVRPKVVNNDPRKNRARFNFAKDIKKRGIKGRHVIFSDECWINNNDNTHRKEWVFKNQTPSARRFQKRAEVKVMIWGAIGYNYKSKLIFVEGTMTAEKYQATILPHVKKAFVGRRGLYFMQDNARPHAAKATKAALAEMRIAVLDWPAHSPHLNPIEKFWNNIHRLIAKRRPTDLASLKRAANDVWSKISQATINRYVEGFDAKIERTIKNEGKPW